MFSLLSLLSLIPTAFGQEWAKAGVRQHWFSTVDFQPPRLASIANGLAVIDKCRALNQTVYVHCKAGKGRSATVAACYMLKVHAREGGCTHDKLVICNLSGFVFEVVCY